MDSSNHSSQRSSRGRQRHRYKDDSSSSDDSDGCNNNVKNSRSSARSSRKSMYHRGLSEKKLRKLHAQWQAEANSAAEAAKFHNRFKRWFNEQQVGEKIKNGLSDAEVLICNLPQTTSGLALSFSSMANIWFKFMEENLDSCVPVAYRSVDCTFPELPGCFNCDVENHWYKLALAFHYACQIFCFSIGLAFLLKVFLARRVFLDEFSNPVTMTPLGLLCMAMAIVSAGKGYFGYCLVVIFSFLHFVLFCW